jgi:hypothetical protein
VDSAAHSFRAISRLAAVLTIVALISYGVGWLSIVFAEPCRGNEPPLAICAILAVLLGVFTAGVLAALAICSRTNKNWAVFAGALAICVLEIVGLMLVSRPCYA